MADGSITYGNVWAQTSPGLKHTVDKMLSWRAKGFQFSPAFKRGFWDGYKHLSKDGRFPAGLVPFVVEELGKAGLVVEASDDGSFVPPVDYCIRPAVGSYTLRDHQAQAVERTIAAHRGVIDHAVGAGKSITAIETVRAIGCEALILVHTKDLMYQIAEDFRAQLNIPGLIGMCGDGIWDPHCITIATFQTMIRRLRDYPEDVEPWLKRIGQVHVDECHHAVAETYGKFLTRLENAHWRIGYSASWDKKTAGEGTGDPETELTVQGHFGPVIHQVTPEQGVETGHLVPVDLFMVEMEGWQPEPAFKKNKDGKTVEIKPFNYDAAVESLVVHHEWRNQAIVALANNWREKGTTMITVTRLEHGRLLADALACPFLEGESKSGDRKSGWSRLRDGSLDLAVVSVIGDEGINVPGIRYLILAGGGKAGHKQVQRLGRGRRAIKGKERLFAADFLDQGMNLGPHTKDRLKAYQADPSITVVQVTLADLLG